MLLQLLRGLRGLGRRGGKRARRPAGGGLNARAEANALILAGDMRAAIPLLQAHLSAEPHDVDSLNDLGCCLDYVGDHAAARRILELALRIDESHLATTLNYAKILADCRMSDAALGLIRTACILRPGHPVVESALCSVAFWRGDPLQARFHAARAWARSPNNLRLSASLLFFSVYADIDEALVAAEHRFWAETLAPLGTIEGNDDARLESLGLPPKAASRVRIGYWSPDLREHSIRYFLRPLLENHDRNRFEVVIYHDSPIADEQTELIAQAADHFISISDLSDNLLRQLFRAHALDILVELAGHTGNNRANLLQERHATLQLTGLGYPATTGLSTIDGKILDRHIVDERGSRYYTEQPLALEGSFWCFDPLEDNPVTPSPPAERNGFVTFACIGNVAKTNPRIFECWADILRQLPQARLHIRSMSFSDPATVKRIASELGRYGMPVDRVVLQEPVSPPKALLESFNEIDIVLDTFPFSGGTTSAFAIHMGVPVVCWAGDSLQSRMGQSMMRNVGMPDWVVDDASSYVATAVRGATDLEGLRRFRTEVRQRLRASPLGNGALYAREFERVCAQALTERRQGTDHRYKNDVPSIPHEEAIQRARGALSAGQNDDASRILGYCLREYPNCLTSHVLYAGLMATEGRHREAACYLVERSAGRSEKERADLLVPATRYWLLAGEAGSARETLQSLHRSDASSYEAPLQIRLLEESVRIYSTPEGSVDGTSAECLPEPTGLRLHVVVPCDSVTNFREIEANIRAFAGSAERLRVTACAEGHRITTYRESLEDMSADIVIWMQKNIRLWNPRLSQDLAEALSAYDIVGLTGARQWRRVDWHYGPEDERAGCLLIPTAKEGTGCEIQVHGKPKGGQQLQSDMAVLDGAMVAFRRSRLPAAAIDWLDPLLEQGGTLLEEVFTHRSHLAGLRLAAHCALGVLWDWRIGLAGGHERTARLRAVESLGLEVPFETPDPPDPVSVPVPSIAAGYAIQRAVFR